MRVTENDNRVPGVLTTCMVPPRKTRSSRLTPVAGSGGTSSTTRPTPRNTPLARTTLPMTVRLFVPGPAANTMVPPSVSVPLVAAAADMAAPRR